MNTIGVIATEFDNEKGPQIIGQYPERIDGLPQYETFTSKDGRTPQMILPSLLIPQGIENRTYQPDFTQVKLYWDNSKEQYTCSPLKRRLDIEDQFSELSIMSCSCAILDSDNERGAVIQSLSIVTKTPLACLEPLIERVLNYHMSIDNSALRNNCLRDIYTLINSVNFELILDSHADDTFQILLRCSHETNTSQAQKLWESRFSKQLDLWNAPNIEHVNCEILYRINESIPGSLPVSFTKIPLYASLYNDFHSGWDTDMQNAFLKCLSQLLRVGSMRVIFVYSSAWSKRSLTGLVDKICYALKFCGKYASTVLTSFPYLDISCSAMLYEYLDNRNDNEVLVIGTSNPIFKPQTKTWDLFYDIDVDTFEYSGTLEQHKTPVDFFASFVPRAVRLGTADAQQVMLRINILQIIYVLRLRGRQDFLESYRTLGYDLQISFSDLLAEQCVSVVFSLVCLEDAIADICHKTTAEKLARIAAIYQTLEQQLRGTGPWPVITLVQFPPCSRLVQKLVSKRHSSSESVVDLQRRHRGLRKSETAVRLHEFIYGPRSRPTRDVLAHTLTSNYGPRLLSAFHNVSGDMLAEQYGRRPLWIHALKTLSATASTPAHKTAAQAYAATIQEINKASRSILQRVASVLVEVAYT